MIRTDHLHQWAPTQMAAEPIKPLPKGCDQQGRYPEAGHAATEIGADDGLDGTGIVRAVIYGLVAWFAFAAAAVTVWGVQ